MQPIRIGCFSAFWGDSVHAARQLVESPDANLDFLVGDYLAEVTMGLLARRSRVVSKQNAPKTAQNSGYIGEFLTYVLAPLLPQLLAKKTRVITNAGGLDPVGLKELIEKFLLEKKIRNVKIAAVWGDDLLPQKSELSRAGAFKPFEPLNGMGSEEHMFSEGDSLLSLNAYLGAGPIIVALHSGAQIIVTGRVVDSALVLAPLAYAYGWDLSHDLDKLAAASLAGHIIECGAQCTGGNFTDWRDGAFSGFGGWSNMGYPIIEFAHDGSFVVTKAARTGGVVNVLSVTEQMLYEVLDPANYLLPDVNLDLSAVKVVQVARDRVRVSGARGRPPTPWLKCTAIRQDGYRIEGALIIPGHEARVKARILGEALIQRANMILKRMGIEKITEYRVETPGAEEAFGDFSVMKGSREVILRIAAAHPNKQALDILGMELAYSATSTAPGITPFMSSGRARASPRFVSSSVLIRRDAVNPTFSILNTPPIPVSLQTQGCREVVLSSKPPDSLAHPSGRLLPLHTICVGRSGDKGDSANIAIIARTPAFYPHLVAQVTPAVIRKHLKHLIDADGVVERYLVPGVNAINFVVTRCLGGGGLGSLRMDRQGKGFAQVILGGVEVLVPDDVPVERARL